MCFAIKHPSQSCEKLDKSKNAFIYVCNYLLIRESGLWGSLVHPTSFGTNLFYIKGWTKKSELRNLLNRKACDSDSNSDSPIFCKI